MWTVIRSMKFSNICIFVTCLAAECNEFLYLSMEFLFCCYLPLSCLYNAIVFQVAPTWFMLKINLYAYFRRVNICSTRCQTRKEEAEVFSFLFHTTNTYWMSMMSKGTVLGASDTLVSKHNNPCHWEAYSSGGRQMLKQLIKLVLEVDNCYRKIKRGKGTGYSFK